MSSTQSPFYGGNAVFKMKTPLYMQLFADAYTTKAATGAAQTLVFEPAQKSTAAITLTTTEIALAEYFTFNTPSNKFVFYVGGAGELATVQAAVADTDATYIAIAATPVTTGIDDEAAAIIASILAESKAKNEITYTFATPLLTLVAVQTGYAPVGVEATTGTTISYTAGQGTWVKVGVLAEDWSLNQEAVEVGTSEKKMIKLADKYAPEFRLMNVDQRAREIIVNNFSNKAVNFALHDKANSLKPTMILHDLILQDSMDLSGDTAQIVLKGSAEYNSSGTSILTYAPFWTF